MRGGGGKSRYGEETRNAISFGVVLTVIVLIHIVTVVTGDTSATIKEEDHSAMPPYVYAGCWSHVNQDAIETWHEDGLTWQRCREWASTNRAPWFVMEYPQGHRTPGAASCGFGGRYDDLERIDDAVCGGGVDMSGRRLGNAGVMAAYRLPTRQDIVRERTVRAPVTLDGQANAIEVVVPDATTSVDACFAIREATLAFCASNKLTVSSGAPDCQNVADYTKRAVQAEFGQLLPPWMPHLCEDDDRLRRCLLSVLDRESVSVEDGDQHEESTLLVTKPSVVLEAAPSAVWQNAQSSSSATRTFFQVEILKNVTSNDGASAEKTSVSLPLDVTADAAKPLLDLCGASNVGTEECVRLHESAERFRMENLYEALVDALALSRGTDFFFVQIGAHVGNTWNDPIFRRLVSPVPSVDVPRRRNWRGVLVEPVPHLFRELQKNYAAVPKGQLVFENSAVCDSSLPSQVFYSVSESAQKEIRRYCAIEGNCRITGSDQWISQIGSLHRHQLEDHFERLFGSDVDVSDLIRDGEIRVPCISFREILEKYGRRSADWVLVDAEGQDESIVRDILSDATSLPYVLAFEHAWFDTNTRSEIYRLLASRGYYCHRINPLDMICQLRSGRRNVFSALGCE